MPPAISRPAGEDVEGVDGGGKGEVPCPMSPYPTTRQPSPPRDLHASGCPPRSGGTRGNGRGGRSGLTGAAATSDGGAASASAISRGPVGLRAVPEALPPSLPEARRHLGAVCALTKGRILHLRCRILTESVIRFRCRKKVYLRYTFFLTCLVGKKYTCFLTCAFVRPPDYISVSET